MAHTVCRHQIVLWLDACRFKCVSYVLRCALARRSSIQMHSYVLRFALAQRLPAKMHFGSAEIRSRALMAPKWADSASGTNRIKQKVVSQIWFLCVLSLR